VANFVPFLPWKHPFIATCARRGTFDLDAEVKMSEREKKRNSLSLSQKLEIIRKIEANPQQRKAVKAEELGIPFSTLCNIILERSTETPKQCCQWKRGYIAETVTHCLKGYSLAGFWGISTVELTLVKHTGNLVYRN